MEPSPDPIRQLVLQTLQELGMHDAQSLGESLLMLADYYAGKEFKFTGVRAVWMASLGQIKFYADDGEVLRVVDVGQEEKKAA